MKKYIAVTLDNLSPVPHGSIYRGDGVFGYEEDGHPREALTRVKEKLTEHDKDFNEVFRKPGFTKEVTAQKLKAGKPLHTPGKGGKKGKKP